tara:strand:+ start:1365 stop:1664 length:300 start_codon:yes stop_codon:yes gene_type:complete
VFLEKFLIGGYVLIQQWIKYINFFPDRPFCQGVKSCVRESFYYFTPTTFTLRFPIGSAIEKAMPDNDSSFKEEVAKAMRVGAHSDSPIAASKSTHLPRM